MRTYIAIVPARRGSKGFPNKNILNLDGETLIARAANLAASNELISKTFVFTDYLEEEIGNLSKSVTYLRRSEFSCHDNSVATDVIWDFLNTNKIEKYQEEDVIIYLQPTSPRRTKSHLEQVLNLALENPHGQVLSVKDSPLSLKKLLTLRDDGLLFGSVAEEDLTSNRGIDKSYLPNGAFYTFEIKRFLDLGHFPINGATPFFMNAHDSLDIDSEHDWNELVRKTR